MQTSISGVFRPLSLLERWFPVPRALSPRAAGVDISDSSVKWLLFERAPQGGLMVESYGSLPLSRGVVVGGVIRDVKALAEVLRTMKKSLPKVHHVHAALPEEVAYVFTMQIPAESSSEDILKLIEFEFNGRVPIPPSASVYDYDIIAPHQSGSVEIGVVVFPREVAESYAASFNAAGITLASLEIEAASIARAVSSTAPDEPVTLIADFGRARTGIALIKQGVPIFTSTVEVGGESMTRAIIEKMSLSPEAAGVFKNEVGLLAAGSDKNAALEIVTRSAGALADEIARHFHYWDTRRDEKGVRPTPVGRVTLVGGTSNLKGISDFISNKVQAPVSRGDVWRNAILFDEYVPPIDRRTSLEYATAVGLALRAF